MSTVPRIRVIGGVEAGPEAIQLRESSLHESRLQVLWRRAGNEFTESWNLTIRAVGSFWACVFTLIECLFTAVAAFVNDMHGEVKGQKTDGTLAAVNLYLLAALGIVLVCWGLLR